MAGCSQLDLSRIAAPMVNQNDLPFRLLVRRYNTQMLLSERLLKDREYLEFHTHAVSETEAIHL